MDILTAIGNGVADLICRLGQVAFIGPVRLAILWMLGFIACRCSFDNGSRSSLIQWSALAWAAVIAICIPVAPLYGWLTGARQERLLKAIVFLGAMFVNALAPAVLPPLLSGRYATQIRLRIGLLLFVISMLLLNLIYACFQSVDHTHG
jgi:hypothetical protein